MTHLQTLRVLLVDDDNDDFIITKGLLGESKVQQFEVEWFDSFEKGLEALVRNQHDICLLDYRLGARNGVDLLRMARARGCEIPIILLTGSMDREVDLQAMEAGASDYLVKAGLKANLLERSIRYAMERRRAAAVATFEQARVVAFGTQIGLVLSQKDSLEAILERCVTAMVKYLNADHAQIWFLDRQEKNWKLGACGEGNVAGEELHIVLEPEKLAQGVPILAKDFTKAAEPELKWLRQRGIKSLASYPLMMEGSVIGAMSLFSRDLLSESILNEMGSVANGIALCIERKQAEALVEKLASFPGVNPDPVLEFSADGTLIYFNEAAERMMKSFGKADLQSILPGEFKRFISESLAGRQSILRQQVVMGDRTLSWSFFPIASSQTVHCYGTEMTEVLMLEAKFRQAQKMESIGQLAAGVAHDFNNILTVIQGYADLLTLQATGDAVSAEPAKQISAAAQRAAGLTRQLLMFSRKQMIQLKVVEVNEVLRSLAKMLPRLLGEHITLRTNYAPELPAIEADTGMIEQIVMNLVVNARDAMPKGGLIEIRTGLMIVDETHVQVYPESRKGQFVCLSVGDTGCGMSRETLSRVFEPFFSTKQVGKGTGLGLATVYGIVKQHEGWIEVKSEVNVGSTFNIFLPISVRSRDVRQEGHTLPLKPARGGSETILLVEDEPNLRKVVKKVLQKHDYRVLEASMGPEALRVFEENKADIKLLLTDMVMPQGMNGKELADRLKERHPTLKVIYTSGYCPEALEKGLDKKALFLPKPYAADHLARVVRGCLDEVAEPITA
jgi:signal transduction histidine kinase/DNA-binding response OmpR family regulator